MKYLFLIAIMMLTACGGNLSDEQRRKIKEGMEMQKIVKISDSEIVTEALDRGNSIFNELEKRSFHLNMDSAAAQQKVRIKFITPGETNARVVEQELIEAYVNGIATNDHPENVQKLWSSEKKDDYDSLLYTRPEVIKRPDGVEELKGIWSIYMSKKDVVLSITRRK